MSKPRVETRSLQGTLEASETGVSFRGTAVPYNALSVTLTDRHPRRGYKERIAPGALRWSGDTVLHLQHDHSGIPLARVSSGTLRFNETPDGLTFEADLPECRADLREALRRGDLDGSVSIGFRCEDDSWQHGKATSLRTVRAAELVELSIVTAGAYKGARGDYKEAQ